MRFILREALLGGVWIGLTLPWRSISVGAQVKYAMMPNTTITQHMHSISDALSMVVKMNEFKLHENRLALSQERNA